MFVRLSIVVVLEGWDVWIRPGITAVIYLCYEMVSLWNIFFEKLCELTGHPSQVQPSPHPQAPVEAHPQPDIVFMV